MTPALSTSVTLLLIAISFSEAQTFPPDEYPWMTPGADDVRSPCPFINTLANHGFIERSGKGVDLFGMVGELTEKFDAAPALFNKLAAGAMSLNLTYTDTNGTERIDIDSLFAHNKQEHDASFVRADEYFGAEESKLVDPMLLESFLSTNPNSSVLTKEDIMEYQTKRILHSRTNNPEVMFSAAQTTSFSAQATLFLAFGQDPELLTVDKARLEEFLTFERFPEGYAPRTSDPDFVPIDVIAEGTLEYERRLEFAANFGEVIAMNLTEPTGEDEPEEEEVSPPDEIGAFPPEENSWMAPAAEDVRSPCPFINTLANHGFIERSGKGVDLFGMVGELTEKFDAAPALFNKLAAGAMSLNLTYTDDDGTERIDIDSLFAHNKQEHDASFVRADEYFGAEESKLVDPMLLEAFLSTNPSSSVLTKEDIMEYQTKRILHSRTNNPEVMFSTAQTTSFSAQATLFLAFGQDPELLTVDKARLKEFLAFERFPEGYAPRTSDPDFVPIDVIAEGTLEYERRLEFAANFGEVIAMNLTEPTEEPDEEEVSPPDEIQAFPPEENSWMAPGAEDVRSPCPFINTLANHGFIERSGKGVDLFGMVGELTEKFDAAPALFNKLAAGAMSLNLTYTDDDGTERIDIDSLFAHNKQEHDASFVRPDEYFGAELSKLVDPTLLQDFLATNAESIVLTKEDIMEYQTKRILHSRTNNPEVMLSTKQTTSFSAQATLFLAFGQHPELLGVEKARLYEFLAFERFPEGYAPRTSDPEFVPIDVIAEGTLEYETRLEFASNFEEVISMDLTDTGTKGDEDKEGGGESGAYPCVSFTFAITTFLVSILNQ